MERARHDERRGARAPLGAVVDLPEGAITSLHERRSGSARYIVSIDGRPAAVISAHIIGELGLRVGMPVDSAVAHRLALAAADLQVFDKAIALLAVRARSARDLHTRLKRAGATDAPISRAMEQLRGLGLVDDEAYAQSLARSRVESGGVSRRRIGQELQQRGVTRDVAEVAIADALGDLTLDELGAATAVAERRMRSLRTLDAATQRRRLYAFLARRGYESHIIATVVRRLVDASLPSDANER